MSNGNVFKDLFIKDHKFINDFHFDTDLLLSIDIEVPGMIY
jgi:hypothetical protein